MYSRRFLYEVSNFEVSNIDALVSCGSGVVNPSRRQRVCPMRHGPNAIWSEVCGSNRGLWDAENPLADAKVR